ncbi:MAG: phosphoribosyl-AMP cyclohydrolase [Promethearchaeota archaeon]
MKKLTKQEIEDILNLLDFSKIENKLIPVIAQDHQSNRVLMLAFANKGAIEKSLETGYAHYYSRSRKQIWKKGEISGHFQEIQEMITDCDNDSLLIRVKQIGAACHKGYYSCFHKKFSNGQVEVFEDKIFNPEKVYKD